MKNIFFVLIISFIFFSCEKKIPESVPVKKYPFTAFANFKPTDKTQSYDVFVSNDKNAPPNMWLFIGQIKPVQLKNNKIEFGFDAPNYCGVTITSKDSVYAVSRETIWGNIQLELDPATVIIKCDSVKM